MKVQVNFLGAITPPKQGKSFVFEFDKDMTIAQFLKEQGYKDDTIKYLVPAIDGETAHLRDMLPDGAQLDIFLPIGGG